MPPDTVISSIKDLRCGYVASNFENEPTASVASSNDGYSPVLDSHKAHVACKVANIKEKTYRRIGKVLDDFPKSVFTGDACTVEDLEPTKPMCVESFTDFPPLQDIFAVREMRQTIAVGVIKLIVKAEKGKKK